MRNLTLFTTLTYIFSCSHVAYSDLSFNIHNALFFCEIPLPGHTKLAGGPRVETIGLKLSFRKGAADFPVDVLRNLIDEWPQRLKDYVYAICGNFE